MSIMRARAATSSRTWVLAQALQAVLGERDASVYASPPGSQKTREPKTQNLTKKTRLRRHPAARPWSHQNCAAAMAMSMGARAVARLARPSRPFSTKLSNLPPVDTKSLTSKRGRMRDTMKTDDAQYVKNPRKRRVCGILLLNKDLGDLSKHAVTRVKKIFGATKAGFAGTLDPLATGVLPVMLGRATTFSDSLSGGDKTYRFSARLGVKTDTADSEGRVLEERDVTCSVDEVHRVVESFKGRQKQTPPMYSAVKIGGTRLYDLAREGITVEREARDINVSRIEVRNIDLEGSGAKGPRVDLEMTVSKGTYIRVIAEDIGEALGCGAHCQELQRTECVRPDGLFSIDNAVRIGQLEQAVNKYGYPGAEAKIDSILFPPDIAVDKALSIFLDEEQAHYLIDQPFVSLYNEQVQHLEQLEHYA